MSVLQAMQTASLRLVGRRPSVFFSSQDQFEQEIIDLANEGALDIAKYTDWQSLVSVATFTGDGSTQDFDIPDGYDRMMLTSDIQNLQNWVWGYLYVASIDEFLWLKARGWGPYPGVWCIYDDQFHFYPAPPSGQTATFPYITRNYAKGSDATVKSSFTKDDDTYRIRGGEDVLALWLVWRWRENKKLDSTGDQENFVKAIDDLAAKDKGSRVYRSNSSNLRGRFYPAWPYMLGP